MNSTRSSGGALPARRGQRKDRGNGLAVAIEAAERGWSVVAMVPLDETADGRKLPKEKWASLGYRSPDEIRSTPVFRRRVGVGILTGPSHLVDVEHDGPAGRASFRRLRAGQILPMTFQFATPQGIHRVFDADGQEFRTCEGQVAAGIDVRGRGGLFLLYDPSQPERRVVDPRAPRKIPAWLAAELPLADEPSASAPASAAAANGHKPGLDVDALLRNGIEPGQHDGTMLRLAMKLAASRDIDRETWPLLAAGILERSGEGVDGKGQSREKFPPDRIMGWWDSAVLKLETETGRSVRSPLGDVYDRTELSRIPKPKPVIEGWLTTGTATLVGATGTNKTFTLIGWACSIATGKPWLDCDVKIPPAPVILVIGEGAGGLDDRISAWEAENGVTIPRGMLTILRLPPTIMDAEFWDDLTELAVTRGARLVWLDTFSSLAPEADETKDAAWVIRGLEELQASMGGGVVGISLHSGWEAKLRARGGSQFEANPDSVIVASKTNEDDDNAPVRLWLKKNKDGPNGLRMYVQRRAVDASCVLEETAEPSAATSGRKHKVSSGDEIRAGIVALVEGRPWLLTKDEVVKGAPGGTTRAREAFDVLVTEGGLVMEKRKRPEGLGRNKRPVTRLVCGLGRTDAATPPINPVFNPG